jgi:hypothetical protein
METFQMWVENRHRYADPLDGRMSPTEFRESVEINDNVFEAPINKCGVLIATPLKFRLLKLFTLICAHPFNCIIHFDTKQTVVMLMFQ